MSNLDKVKEMTKLKEFKPILERVKSDNTLDMQLREDHIDVYYRGGCILKLTSLNPIAFTFDINYLNNDSDLKEKVQKNKLNDYLKLLPCIKDKMDLFFTENNRIEREFQQYLSRENNYFGASNSTDYFIIDVEVSKEDQKFDAVAINWDATKRSSNDLRNYIPKLCIIEIKQGISSLEGPSGIIDHLKKFDEYIKNPEVIEELKQEMLEKFQIKRDLELIKYGDQPNNNAITGLKDEIDFIFVLTNYVPRSQSLLKILNKIEEEKFINFQNKVNIKFATSNFFGFGLYDESIYTIQDFISKFEDNIFSSRN